ncbi:MAG: hypothetical protein HWE18_11990 [Gammaproteobacteria bacterium]|nr:hypothetical protein [Gammaproteobacteria bacterium]
MKRLILCFAVVSLLSGCSNSVEENVGALPNIKITGTVLNGNVRNASVQVVGIDKYGQPQRNSNGDLYADRFYTDDNGQFNLEIQGAATGSLLFVVKAYDNNGTKTEIRCALVDGCLDEQGASVAYGAWYEAHDEFELWAAVNDAQSVSQVNISPFTYLAAKLAFSDFQWDGVGTCNKMDETDCAGTIAVNSMFTPQSIHEANTRMQAMLGFTSDTPVLIKPYSPFALDDSNSVASLNSAMHGLLTLTLQYRAKQANQTMVATLDQWLDAAYLKNQGQLYGDDASDTQWDLKTLYDDAIAIYNTIASPNAFLTSAKDSFVATSTTLTNAVSNFSGTDYSADLSDQITAAKAFVAKVQGWFIDYETKDFNAFLDADTATELAQFEIDWEAFQANLGPQLQTVFLPMVQMVDYSLKCLANQSGSNACSTISGSYVFEDATASVTFDSTNNIFTYNSTAQPDTHLRGSLLNSDENGLIKTFKFLDDVEVINSAGQATVQSRTSGYASLKVTLGETLQAGVEPEIKRIEVVIPKLTLKSADGSGMYYTVTDGSIVLQGASDPVRPAEPIHFNVHSIDLPGQLVNGADKVDVGILLTANNANNFYGQERFPDLDFVWYGADIKRFVQFDETGLDGTDFAGFLALPSDVVLGETLIGKVEYNEVTSFAAMTDNFKTASGLSSPVAFEYGELKYPGGSTSLVIFKENNSDTPMVMQCLSMDDIWQCSTGISVGELGCESAFKDDDSYSANATVAEAFWFLKNNLNEEGVGCIPQVKIPARGVYDVEYGAISQFTDGDAFDITLNEPAYLGISSFNVRLLSRFKGASDELDDTPLHVLIYGGMQDRENFAISASVSHGYYGDGLSDLFGLIPFGERTLHMMFGTTEESDTDALAYYILDNQIQMTMFAFDYNDTSSYHNQPLGHIRYAGNLVGTLRKENGLYVIRYADGSWQLL